MVKRLFEELVEISSFSNHPSQEMGQVFSERDKELST
jgi:hypothetical protein